MADPSRSRSAKRIPQTRPEGLLERDGELALLDEALADAVAGEGSLVVVEGPAGIGKSSVLSEGLAKATEAGFATVTARGTELEREFAFGLVRQLFEPVLATGTTAQRKRLFDGAAALARPLFEAHDADDLAPRGEASQAILHGLYWLTANLAARQPIALVIDDAHWADAPSLRFVAYLANRVDGLPLALVLAARPFEHQTEVDLLDEIAASPSAVTIRPGPLSVEAVDSLVRSGLAGDPDRTFVDACFEATNGNPLLFRELLMTLKSERIEPTAAEAPRVLAVAPKSVARSVARRLRQLEPEAGEIARALALLGDQADAGLAARLAGLDRDTAIAATVALSWADILTPDGAEFVHPMVRAAVHSELSPVEHARRHAEAAALLREAGAEEETVALHALAGEPQGRDWVVETLRRSARRAHVAGAPDVAARYLKRALAEPPTEEQRTDVAVELGLAELDALDWSAGVERVSEVIEATDDPAARGQLALRMGRSLFTLGLLPQAAEWFERGLAGLDGQDRDLERELETQLISLSIAVPALAARVVDRIERLQQVTDEIEDAPMLALLGTVAVATAEPAADGAALVDRALLAGLSVVDEPTAWSMAGLALMHADRFDDARRHYDDAISVARRGGAKVTVGFVVTLRAQLLVRMGDLAAAEADARSVLEPFGDDVPVVAPWLTSSLVDILVERGELDAASRLVDQHGLAGQLPDLFQMYWVLDSVGKLRSAQGRVDEAVERLRDCGRRVSAWDARVRNPGLLPWRTSLALALVAGGEREEALELAREEAALARGFGVPRELGMALRAEALAVGGDASVELLREAVAALERTPAELERARALTDLGATLRRQGSRSAAREPLRAGLDLAHRCGGSALAERAHEELVATGARPRRLVRSGVEALTASERRVATMASEGLTNKELAQALFVTEKTVEGHLASCYRKLDITSRSELPQALGKPEELAVS